MEDTSIAEKEDKSGKDELVDLTDVGPALNSAHQTIPGFTENSSVTVTQSTENETNMKYASTSQDISPGFDSDSIVRQSKINDENKYLQVDDDMLSKEPNVSNSQNVHESDKDTQISKSEVKSSCSSGKADTETNDSNEDDDIEIVDIQEDSGSSTKEKRICSSIKKLSKKRFECLVCKKMTRCRYNVFGKRNANYLCDDYCFKAFKARLNSFLQSTSNKIASEVACGEQCKPKSKICFTCGKSLHNELNAFLAPIEGKGLKDFCGHSCYMKYEQFSNKGKSIQLNKSFLKDQETSHNVRKCDFCKAAMKENMDDSIQLEDFFYNFCSPTCLNTFKAKKTCLERCSWCNSERANFDMIENRDEKNNGESKKFCNLNCLSLYKVNIRAKSNKDVHCDQCHRCAPAQYHLTLSDSSIRNFCSYPCVKIFQSVSNSQTSSDRTVGSVQMIIQPPPAKQFKNRSLLCKPIMQNKGTSSKTVVVTKCTQTDEYLETKELFVPCPTPMIVPAPISIHSMPLPLPTILPVPVPVPCFIPTTRKSADGIMKKIKELQDKIPSDPYEAEMLMMAEAVAIRTPGSDDEEDDDYDDDAKQGENGESGEDMLQIALRMASEMTQEDHALDLETSIAPAPLRTREIHQNVQMYQTTDSGSDVLLSSMDFGTSHSERSKVCKRKNGNIGTRTGSLKGGATGTKRHKTGNNVMNRMAGLKESQRPVVSDPPADFNFALKFTYGINAYKHWVMSKNTQIEAAYEQHEQNCTSLLSSFKGGRGPRLFKLDPLQASTDEINQALSYFVKEVRKPNGEEYAPDSILYLCLGIQEYMYENGRIDNMFTDCCHEKFTNSLNEVLGRYEVRLNAQGMLVCRIEEEHLWECKQLGAHSPHVLLNTLAYFNTKYFLLRSPQDHIGLSFSHIVKQWKKTNTQPGKQGRSVFLRYYCPLQTEAGDSNQKKKRDDFPVLEQAENVNNPLRCPVKLYEFYISKCPESIKNRSDVFYLVPERSCVPDSPVWYSTQPYNLSFMTKTFNRLQVVREIQEAFLSNMNPIYL